MSTTGNSSSSSSYFPKCRKDAQCKCTMCVHSLNATRDLRPGSSRCDGRGGTLLSAMGRAFGSPISSFSSRSYFFWSPGAAGTSSIAPQVLEPAFDEIAAGNGDACLKRSSFSLRKRLLLWRLALVTAVVAFSVIVSPVILERAYPGHLSSGLVIQVANESRTRITTVDKVEFIRDEIQGVLRAKKVCSCTGNSSKWTLLEEGSLIRSRCRLYSSLVEDVSIWGYPIVTAGVLGRRPSKRLMFVLAGRVVEWKEGQLEHRIHAEGEYWTHSPWAASVIHLDRSTWILEYSTRSFDGTLVWFIVKNFLSSLFKVTTHFTLPSSVTIPT